jgi:ABC-2 type transport system permease protein
MAGLFILPAAVGGGRGSEKRIVLVDETPEHLGERFTTILETRPESQNENSYVVERVSGSYDAVRDDLNARVLGKDVEGYVVLPADLVKSNEIVYRARNIANRTVQRAIREAASRAAQGERLREAGLDGAEVASLIRAVTVDGAQVTASGEAGRDAESTFWFAYIVAFLIYFMTVIYGVNVMRSVLEEKTNRIAEVMVSSVKASHLMLGKVLGVSAAALAQVAIWAAIITVVATQSNVISNAIGLPPGALDAFTIDPVTGLLFVAFFITGFLLFSAIFSAVGAAMTSEQEAQSTQIFVMMPLILPLLFLGVITNEPMSPMSTALGLIPFTAPIAMPMRMATTPIPAGQIALSLLFLALAVALVAWLAGKIYRIGMLATGKRPTLRELARWLRAA